MGDVKLMCVCLDSIMNILLVLVLVVVLGVIF